MANIVPGECQQIERVWAYLQYLTTLNAPIKTVHVFDAKQSMPNGGGPACLKRPIALSHVEYAAVKANVFMNDKLFDALIDWADRYYREVLCKDDLADPNLIVETHLARQNYLKF